LSWAEDEPPKEEPVEEVDEADPGSEGDPKNGFVPLIP